MSLWKKWEKEKLEKMGLKPERDKSDVEIFDTRPRPNTSKQLVIVGVAVLCCLLLVAVGIALQGRFGTDWNSLPGIRHLSDAVAPRLR